MQTSATPGSSGDCQSNLEDEKDSTIHEEADGWTSRVVESSDPHNGSAFFDAEDNLKFYPPLYRQRYETVRDILNDKKWFPPPSSIVEFGCAEVSMFPYFKQVAHITKILMVDIDSDLLEYYGCRTAPLNCDFLNPRENPLHVEVLCGSVADHDARLLGANAVVCIELIEHLEADIVDGLEKTIFGFIEPEIAIFTTPNSDFNVLLNGMQGKFRHWDHKFEWTRNEFADWTNKIISQYPHYRVEISGVGAPPEGNEDVGYCSQLALFIRNSDYTPVLTKEAKEVYTPFRVYDHPVKPADTRSDEEKLQDEIQFQLNKMGYYECYLGDGEYAEIPLCDLTTAVQRAIPTADPETVRNHLSPEDVVEKDGNTFVIFNFQSSKLDSESDSYQEENHNLTDEENYENDLNPSEAEEEIWEMGPPARFADPDILAEYHIALAKLDNASNLVQETHSRMREVMGWPDPEDSDIDDDDDEDDDYSAHYTDRGDERALDCEKKWNSSVPPPSSKETCSQEGDTSKDSFQEKIALGISPDTQDEFLHGGVCAASSPIYPSDEPGTISRAKREPITDSGVDLSPLLNSRNSQDELGDIFPSVSKSKTGVYPSARDLPKSTSVEVLHLDGSCTLKRRAGLEYVEFAPSTSVALCYTGQRYCDTDKVSSHANMSLSSERKSLDGSLVRDVADSCSLDFAGDSGYPNSSSHHDVDVDLTPEQVDDISSENDDRSNHSFSEDELSESLDRAPAFLRRVIHPRHPVVPIVFENVENGDLANNNRDGEGNNAVAPLGDEREFLALVQEGDMQPLMAAPVAEDIILPHNADPFPPWLMDLLNSEDADDLPAAKMGDELEHDEGLGEDSV